MIHVNVENPPLLFGQSEKKASCSMWVPVLTVFFLLVGVPHSLLLHHHHPSSSLQVDLPFATPVVLAPNENEDQPLETRGFWLGIFAAQGGSVIRLYGNTCKADNRNVR